MKKDYCVIGIGRFGKSVINTLVDNNLSVMALDNNRKLIDEIAPKVAFSTYIDSTNIKSLQDVGIKSFSHVFVTIGENVEASIMTCAALVELGVKNITARAKNPEHEMVLRKMGVNDVVRPEEITGSSVAVRISTSSSSQIIAITKRISIITIVVGDKMSGFKVSDCKTLKSEKASLSAITRKNKTIWPTEDTVIHSGDKVHIVAPNKSVGEVEKEFAK